MSRLAGFRARFFSIKSVGSLYIAVVLIAVIYRYCWLDSRDPFKCGVLLNQGAWLDPANSGSEFHLPPSRQPFQKWQPSGCMMYDYQRREISACLGSKRVLFIGDSSLRQVFWALVKKMDHREGTELQVSASKNSDLNYKMYGVELDFVWDPYLNSSRVKDELNRYRQSNMGAPPTQGSIESAAVILLGTGHNYARHIGMNMLKQFKTTIDDIVPYMLPDPSAPAMTVSDSGSSPNLLLLSPVQTPWYEHLSPSRAATITKAKVSAMNDYLQQLSAFQGADVAWSYSQMSFLKPLAYEESGLHVVENVAARKADVLLNLRCNAESARTVGFPYDRTCCSNYRSPNWLQLGLLFVGLVLLPSVIWLSTKDPRRYRYLPTPQVLWPVQVFLLSVIFCFYTDRTQMFNKALKHYRQGDLFMLWGLAATVGILSVRALPILHSNAVQPKPSGSLFLTQNLMDEWQGWMQFMVLAYHYTDASTSVWVYRLARLMIASYLFLTGYSHTTYFLKSADYSFERVTAVFLRLNLLSCILPYAMRTDYLYYYFAPLLSFWFLVVYLTLRVQHHRNDSLGFFISKVLSAMAIVTILTQVPYLMEIAFAILRITCNIHWSVPEWRLRAFLDLYITFVGMICAYLAAKLSTNSTSDYYGKRSVDWISHNLRVLKRLAVFLSILLTIIFFLLTRRALTKSSYNQWSPFISVVPILSYFILRHSTPLLRSFYSPIFVWLGQRSTEAFTLQYHLWLAGDTNGLLSLGIFGQTAWRLNFVVVTPIFLLVTWLVSEATIDIVAWILKEEGEHKLTLSPVTAVEITLDDFSDLHRKSHEGAYPWNYQDEENETSRDYKLVGWKGAITRVWNRDLKTRVCIIVGTMWFCNWVSCLDK